MRHFLVRSAATLVMCGIGILLFFLPSVLESRRHRADGLGIGTGTATDLEAIRGALSTVMDPELGINIVDLGLVRDIEETPDGTVIVTMIFTAPLCPLADVLTDRAKNAVGRLPGVEGVAVIVDNTVRWNTDMLSEDARQKLREYYP